MLDSTPPDNGLSPHERLALMALGSRPEWQTETTMHCLKCGYDYVHMVASGVHQNDHLHLICDDGVHILRGMPALGRGSAVVTIYSGECGHTYATVQRFHKGQTFLGAIELPSGDYLSHTLWRD